MILKLAWRNIWRNKRRTWILISAVTVGIFGLFFFLTITQGAVKQAIQNIIDSGVGHIQIHKAGYLKDPEVKKFIKDPDQIIKKIKSPLMKIISKRVNLQGVIYSPTETSPVQAIGGELGKEKLLTRLDDFIIKGHFPQNETEILIGSELAETLEVGLDDKVVISSADITGELSSYAFRIGGIFKSPSKEINKYLVMIDINAASKIAGYNNMANEIIIRLKEDKALPSVLENIKQKIDSNFEVLSWGDVYPALKYQFEIFNEMMFIFGFIILLGATFGIMNVFFMSIYERMREFGVIRAIGVKPIELGKLIILEGLLIGLVSIFISSILCFILYIYLSIKGLNLSIFSRSLEIWGTGAIIYPSIDLPSIMILIFLVLLIILISVLIPARKASKIVIAEALKYV
ncbi:ABC transporter permease [Candidatus Aminicenantes bacterium AC-708-M15]|jgi:ABC-type lipoprotein release transport system permease subunit|nr:ABC transporter permease [SCandidatus Aminicenantes bacterium Aminicenantia_JdfR_composite]MCP2598215.1 ABC transporter permease [Candidatus Aminicenantes bacterium AC-335-L06]MCP2603952.1 ABC transporter permease [Candidatus Aminicenantes bacterium AC-708-M15]MCP2605592.1 ABC transporter permease [Candidatus Aminicenantes bacterium AC-335-O07]